MPALQITARIEDLSRGRLLPVETDAMEPTLAERGYAVVAPCDRVAADAVYVLMYGGETIIRRCQMLIDGSVRLMLDNPKYAAGLDVIPRATVDDMVLGRVVGACNPI